MAYSFLDAAYEVLETAKHPLTYQELWDEAKAKGLSVKINTSGKTPWRSLGALMYVDVRDNSLSKFIKVGSRPARFFLKDRQSEISDNLIFQIQKEEKTKALTATSKYKERDLHPILAYFANSNPSFNRGRSIYTKTILHEKSLRQGYNEWVHPDMVGFYLPIDWRREVIELNRLLDNNSIRLFSFEIKKSLNKANYRESYFQAVSNSSWAHEGYLVAAEVHQDDDFLAELERLAASFGIGIIQLDLTDVDSSPVLYPARIRETLDWETINKLCDQNSDFEKFIQDVKIDFDGKRIHRAEYDSVVKDPAQYIAEKLKI
jgi:hypothetical protein